MLKEYASLLLGTIALIISIKSLCDQKLVVVDVRRAVEVTAAGAGLGLHQAERASVETGLVAMEAGERGPRRGCGRCVERSQRRQDLLDLRSAHRG